MKPSRAPIAHEPEKKTKRTAPPPVRHLPHPEELRLNRLIRDGAPDCPWCGEKAERSVRVGKTFSLSCWTEHG